MAVLIWRSQEMRMVSRTMTEVALRLAEPENIAKESVVTVSQAIRREVAAMGDGIERALARASELEVLVHNEVASLERSYTDNELRVRRLIDELVTEREAIVQNADRVRQAIRGSHDSLSSDLAGVTDQIAVAADSAAKRISDLLSGRSHTITQNIGQTGEQVVGLLATRTESLFQRLNEAGDKLSDTIINRGDLLVDRLDSAAAAVSDTFAEHSDVDRRPARPDHRQAFATASASAARRCSSGITATGEGFTDSLLARGDDFVGAAGSLQRQDLRGVLAARRRAGAGDQPGRRGADAQPRGARPGGDAAPARGGQLLRRHHGGADAGDRRAPPPGAGSPRRRHRRPRSGRDRAAPARPATRSTTR